MKKYTTAQRLIAAAHLKILTTRYGFNTTPAQRETLKTLAKIAGNYGRLSAWELFNEVCGLLFELDTDIVKQDTVLKLSHVLRFTF